MAIVTISRGPYSGIEALAVRLSEDLDYRLLSREELLARSAQEFGALESQLESALKHVPKFLEGRGLSRRHFVYCIQATMAKAVQSDNLVYYGEAGHLLLKGIPHHLRVRMVANVEDRVGAAMERCGLRHEKAVQYILESDKALEKWVKWIHGVDINDPATVDLTINLEHIPIQSACALIAETADRDFRTTPQSQKVVDDLVVSSQIRAKIGLDRKISDARIAVEADDGVVTITVNPRFAAEVGRVKELASQIPGVKVIESKVETGQ
jgi:cytidylate kinase